MSQKKNSLQEFDPLYQDMNQKDKTKVDKIYPNLANVESTQNNYRGSTISAYERQTGSNYKDCHGNCAMPVASTRCFWTIADCELIVPDCSSRQQYLVNEWTNPMNCNTPTKPNYSWNDQEVKMPPHDKNKWQVKKTIVEEIKDPLNPNPINKPTWKVINKVLSRGFTMVKEIESAIKSYNCYENIEFDVLRAFLDPTLPTTKHYMDIINQMSQLALELPIRVTRSIPLMKQKVKCEIVLSQSQIACLLANGFFCTFPRRSRDNQEYQNYPKFNFISLFKSHNDIAEKQLKIEKLKCVLNYFEKYFKLKQDRIVSFERRVLKNKPDWKRSVKPFTGLKIESCGSIQKEGKKYTEIDFANKLVGGGVLNTGALQEELRFLASPELFASKLFTEALLDDEALLINGTVQFNSIQGYGRSFQWMDCTDDLPGVDRMGRTLTQVVAIDATDYQQNSDKQFDESFILRNLNKAFCGFQADNKYRDNKKPAIASGKWGCGGFNGCRFLNTLIQFMAASEADRDLILFTKNDSELETNLRLFCEIAAQNHWTVGSVFARLVDYQNQRHRASNVIDYICQDHIYY